MKIVIKEKRSAYRCFLDLKNVFDTVNEERIGKISKKRETPHGVHNKNTELIQEY